MNLEIKVKVLPETVAAVGNYFYGFGNTSIPLTVNVTVNILLNV